MKSKHLNVLLNYSRTSEIPDRSQLTTGLLCVVSTQQEVRHFLSVKFFFVQWNTLSLKVCFFSSPMLAYNRQTSKMYLIGGSYLYLWLCLRRVLISNHCNLCYHCGNCSCVKKSCNQENTLCQCFVFICMTCSLVIFSRTACLPQLPVIATAELL